MNYYLVTITALCLFGTVISLRLVTGSKETIELAADIIKTQNKKISALQSEDRSLNKKIDLLKKDLDDSQLLILHLQNEIKKHNEKRK